MQLNTVFLALLVAAEATFGNPIAKEATTTETILFKRGDVLDKRGHELAALHGVDVNEMYRHSVVKRSNDDDITIWVHNSFTEATITEDSDSDSSPLQGRQSRVWLPPIAPFYRNSPWNGYSDACGASTFTGLTNTKVGAFLFGVDEIIRWARANVGSFHLEQRVAGRYTGLIVAGSNSGANAIFMAEQTNRRSAGIVGNSDIGDLVRDSKRFERQYGSGFGGWRTAATGSMSCMVGGGSSRTTVNWRLTRTGHWV